MKKLTIALVCMAVIGCAIPMASAGPLADYGDAPDNTTGQVFAYLGVEGQFPSLYATANTRIPGRTGVHHLITSEEWLNLSNTSSTTTKETDALITDLDFDENMSAILYIVKETDPFPPYYIAYILVPVGVSADASDVRRHLNVLIDRNRDGEWKNTSSGKEWVVTNQIVGTEPDETEFIISKPFILYPTEVTQNMWMRVTFTRTRIDESVFSGVGGWDGSAPSDGFSYGETEDINATPNWRFMKHIPPYNATAKPQWQIMKFNRAKNRWEGKFEIDTVPRLVIAPLPLPPEPPWVQNWIKIKLRGDHGNEPFGDLSVQAPGIIGPIVLNNMGIPNKLIVKLDNQPGGIMGPLPIKFDVFVDNPPRAEKYWIEYTVSTDPDEIIVAHYDELELEILPMIESSDSSGNKKDKFKECHEVHAYGSGYVPEETYDLFIVKDRIWTDSMPIPPYIVKTTVSADANGDISPDPTLIWPSGVQGKYDIIVDVDGNGNYDEGIDALDDMDVNDAGFEVPTLTTIGLMALIGLLLVVTMSRIKRQ